MSAKRYNILKVIFLTSLILLFSCPKEIESNPVYIAYFRTGPSLILSENVTMPRADVNISISSEEIQGRTFKHVVSLSSDFDFVSATSLNATIAFAFPSTWIEGRTNTIVNESDFMMSSGNDELNYTILSSQDLHFAYSDSGLLFPYNDYSELFFAATNLTLIGNATKTLRVEAEIIVTSWGDYFDFTYFLGTGKYWSGDIDETIRITLTNTSLYHTYEFLPTDNLQIINTTPRVTGVWNLNPSTYSRNEVGVLCRQYIWSFDLYSTITSNQNHTTEFDDSEFLLPFAIIVFGVVGLVAVIVYLFDYRKK